MHGVEAAIEDLVGLALPAVLGDEHAGHNLKQITTGTVGRGLNDGLIAGGLRGAARRRHACACDLDVDDRRFRSLGRLRCSVGFGIRQGRRLGFD